MRSGLYKASCHRHSRLCIAGSKHGRFGQNVHSNFINLLIKLIDVYAPAVACMFAALFRSRGPGKLVSVVIWLLSVYVCSSETTWLSFRTSC